MPKLICNLLADYAKMAFIQNDKLYPVSWEYTTLNDVQESCGILLGNKLKKHIAWNKHKMNVTLVAQTPSSSVADATDFLNLELKLPKFEDSHSTNLYFQIDVALI